MNINEQIQNAEREIKWVREYASNGDAFQQKKSDAKFIGGYKSPIKSY